MERAYLSCGGCVAIAQMEQLEEDGEIFFVVFWKNSNPYTEIYRILPKQNFKKELLKFLKNNRNFSKIG